RDEVLYSSQFIVSSDRSSRARFSRGEAVVTAKVNVKGEEAGGLRLDLEYTETRVQADVVVVDGVRRRPTSRSGAQTSVVIKLGEPITLGGGANILTTKDKNNVDIRRSTRNKIVLRLTEFKPGDLTPEEIEEADQVALVGVWNATELICNGRPAHEASVKPVEFKFINPGQFSARGLDSNTDVHKFEFELDAGRSIKRVTVYPADGRWKGIPIGGLYELNGDVLRIAIRDFEATDPPPELKISKFATQWNSEPIDFPAKFESTAGSSIRLITLKRKRGNS
ncbi:MAG: hypothetical protein JWN70_4233, partial [Planctomycetaceae bacterium]|nr:hypothetical protein [Planctomycetaceae bacterium]